MNTSYKYIRFTREWKGRWTCKNKRSGYVLGIVSYYDEWSQWVFAPALFNPTVHSASCLRDIADFLEQLNDEEK